MITGAWDNISDFIFLNAGSGFILNVVFVIIVIGAIVAIVGVVANYIHRYSRGDVSALGARKV